MIKSMTGFGKAEGQIDLGELRVEVRSLNSKGIDSKFRLPSILSFLENDLRQLCQKELYRGKIDVVAFLNKNGSESASQINEPLFRSYHQQLSGLADELKLDKEKMLEALLRIPNVWEGEQTEVSDADKEVIMSVSAEAMSNLDQFRAEEGKNLMDDLQQNLSSVREKLAEVEELAPERLETRKREIEKKLADLADVNPDQNRFEQEMIYFLEKLDINEEIVRLKSHCEYFESTMNEESLQGKKLGFIAQEMGREINTIGSKASHAVIQKKVVEMKDELEKIKEQTLNIL